MGMDRTDGTVLLIEEGPNGSEMFPLGSSASIGRQSDNEIVIPYVGVSRQHARIVKTETGYYLRDLASTNGTYVNREKITHDVFLLRNGDRIQLGSSEVSLVFRHVDSRTDLVNRVRSSPSRDRFEMKYTQLWKDVLELRDADSSRTVTHSPYAKAAPRDNTPKVSDNTSREGNLRFEIRIEGSEEQIMRLLARIWDEPVLQSSRLTNGRRHVAELSEALRLPSELEPVVAQIAAESQVGRARSNGVISKEGIPALSVLLRDPNARN